MKNRVWELWLAKDTAEGPSQERDNSPLCADSPQDVDIAPIPIAPAYFERVDAKPVLRSRDPSPMGISQRTVSRPTTPMKKGEVGRGVPFRRPTPPVTPKDVDFGPACDAQARIRRIISRSEVKDPDHDPVPSSPAAPPMAPASTVPVVPPPGHGGPQILEDSRGALGESDLGLPGTVMDPILEDGGIVVGTSRPSLVSRLPALDHGATLLHVPVDGEPVGLFLESWVVEGAFGLAAGQPGVVGRLTSTCDGEDDRVGIPPQGPAERNVQESSLPSLRDIDEGIPISATGPRYAGTPAQAAEALLNGVSEAVHSPFSAAPDARGAAAKASMPRHVACIRKQVLASRRLEELDLCPLGSTPRRIWWIRIYIEEDCVNAPFEVSEDADTPAPLPRLGGSAGDRSGSAGVGSWQARRGSPPPVMPLDVGTEPVSLGAGVSPRPQARPAMRERQAPRVPPVNLEAMRIGSEMTSTPASQGGSAKPSSRGWSHGPAALDEPLVLATGVEGIAPDATYQCPDFAAWKKQAQMEQRHVLSYAVLDPGADSLNGQAPCMDPPAGGLDMPLQPPPIEAALGSQRCSCPEETLLEANEPNGPRNPERPKSAHSLITPKQRTLNVDVLHLAAWQEPAFPFESELAEELPLACLLFGAERAVSFRMKERDGWFCTWHCHVRRLALWSDPEQVDMTLHHHDLRHGPGKKHRGRAERCQTLISSVFAVKPGRGEWARDSAPVAAFRPEALYSEYVARAYPADPTMEDKAREENLKLGAGKRCCFTCPGEPGTKFRPMYDQMIKNLQHSNKALAKAFGIKKVSLKEDEVPEDPTKTEAQNIMRFGRHQILPSFWYLLIQLTKRGRRFSVVFRSFSEDQLVQAQKELQLFAQCQHPAYNGQNKTQKPPLMDGNKGSRDMRLSQAAIGRMDRMGGFLRFRDRPVELAEPAPAESAEPQADLPESAFRPTEYTFPPYHEAYAGLMHQILQTTNTAAIVDDLAFWETHERVSTAGKMLLIDRAETKARRMLLTSEEMLVPRLIFPRKKDMPTALKKVPVLPVRRGELVTKVQHIFFDGNVEKEDAACVDVRNAVNGEPIPLEKSSNVYLHRVDIFQAVTDVEYFLKATEACELSMSKMIVEDRHAEGVVRALSEEEQKKAAAAAAAMTPKEWLYRNIIPALLPALEACQRDRPEDPIEFIAFYMLRHSKQYSKTLKA
ncbi:unnamed protein product [Symbiodinium sp. KB8]|nr:unnamed protein product [Symbiodinium sp. KB8]